MYRDQATYFQVNFLLLLIQVYMSLAGLAYSVHHIVHAHNKTFAVVFLNRPIR